ncbi:uncharacterized protein LOC106091950 [Stomoxys calcitrans]|uniref:Uncharacterized protein n=1 Tax=Stomoxys calcitrans TaxID=35570 RepID=A0A1I8PC83_STOCA|nr:uncharacterized protein LOC106091950 [Stomoxys calcitrans]XP_013114121.1 uncharacterized protein LOC106091950 [Stomoxys calcitrans]XP_013114122.1 uncharacterized protein LOC106091950 [Stomoxys calcitrans]XP_013114125.1 uncharacterized protein LOC106091950 [Stomoxys calcitrans]XP_013114126.1 uncharacterized protein LOC106091950 [Stomoxys calcitrans]XP_013114127.1 uncharacterized protein LOC106091950 [Stomoxys calcitrans]
MIKRDVSSASTIGRDDAARKPLLKAYMFQRRVLFCCSCLMVLSLLTWIIAIATDHWIIITGAGGIFIPETRRFFMSSHSGLWRFCRHTAIPTPLKDADVVRNFTAFAIQNPTTLREAQRNCSRLDYIKEFNSVPVQFPLESFTEEARQRMFAHWVRNDKVPFNKFKDEFYRLVLSTQEARDELIAIDAKPRIINPVDVGDIVRSNVFGKALQTVVVNGTNYYFVIPETAQAAMFKGWNEKAYIPKLFWPYAKELGLPAYVLDDNRVILQLVPPKPPKNMRNKHYEYAYNSRCKYIDMFPSAGERMDPGFDWTLMDYIRSQASFACITVFVMILGSVFSFYTFANPRYMFKRLAGGINLVAGSTALVVLQVLFASVDYTKEHLFYSYPDGAELTYGYGVFFAWFTFGVNVTSGILFIWYSGKKKGAKAPTDEIAMADEMTIMGR